MLFSFQAGLSSTSSQDVAIRATVYDGTIVANPAVDAVGRRVERGHQDMADIDIDGRPADVGVVANWEIH